MVVAPKSVLVFAVLLSALVSNVQSVVVVRTAGLIRAVVMAAASASVVALLETVHAPIVAVT